MMRVLPILLAFGLSLQGCTNYLYQDRIQAMDSAGRERQIVLYWSKTKGLFTKPKAGPASLLTECGAPIMFVEQPPGIFFRGTPGQDRLIIGVADASIPTEIPCGSFISQKRFVDIPSGPLRLTVFCEPVAGEFSVGRRTYIQARQEPYEFTMTATRKWSLTGKVPEGPVPPPCNE